jgi:hypothetical protein
MREVAARIPLGGIRLTDSRSGGLVDLGELTGVMVLIVIRHRY